MNSEDVKALKALLSKPLRIVIVPHKNPDGDAIGSSLGLWHYLKSIGHEVRVIVPNDYPKFLKWMPGTNEVLNFERDNAAAVQYLNSSDLCFTLDFNQLGRVGQMTPILEGLQATFIMIDHHQAPDNYAQITYSDSKMSSTSEMVFNFINSLGDVNMITSEIADCLYAGIVTDTGSFKYSSTTSKTHLVAAELINKGANNFEVQNQIFDTNTPSKLQLLGCALKNMVILKEYNTAYTCLSQEELDAHNYKKGDTEGFVNYGLTLQNILFAVIFIENKEERIIKISFRSEGNFSVNEFARNHFHGGGHTNAAGGRSESDMEGTIKHFEALLENYRDQLSK
ncbi:bifunctional oligoribonuclease/PAP phosphatase NrnA [uncultured Eudoraea sp.]|uniref:DHH family phosphoesterase n=1 Tax=uncultured Eudoraea sp. TaxID=1035614 RepID=UPI0026129F62|nr:bifunctional oligoribonuclease/PAP phosphatase NrnA [uncultured Eudoraea sp.]